jgi:hypothetical protein
MKWVGRRVSVQIWTFQDTFEPEWGPLRQVSSVAHEF